MGNVGVATKAVIYNQKGEVLILNKSELEDFNPKTMDLPGGRLDFGEDPYAGIKREIKEETGIEEVEIIGPSNAWSIIKEDFNLVGITFAVKTETSDVTVSHEHDNFRWVKPDEFEKLGVPEWIVNDELKARKLF